jgi:ATP-dependent DNA helicase DinG
MSSHFTARPEAAVLQGISLELEGGGVLEARTAMMALAERPHLLCHAAFVTERLAAVARASKTEMRAAREQRHLDVAELFAFVCPAQAAVPTPAGLARSLALEPLASETETLVAVMDDLLRRLANRSYPFLRETAETAAYLARARWPWAEPVVRALSQSHPSFTPGPFATGLNVWDRLEEWEEDAPRGPARQDGVSPDEATAILREALGPFSESRQSQRDYAAAAVHAFAPRQSPSFNNIWLAEAGTGLGKTLAYLAPAWAWSAKNRAPVWISTYTKNLQRQLDQETVRLCGEPEERRRRIVVRKGRENYVCLLNMQEVFGRLGSAQGRGALLAALISRWARFSRDGDMVGGDFPSWLFSLFSDLGGEGEGRQVSPAGLGLTDRRGECIYVACSHYRKCFIEKSLRAGRQAQIVIANHALVLHQAAVDYSLGPGQTAEEEAAPGGLRRLVFDEGHHLFDAADSAFSSHLTALEAAELRRWIRGPEAERRRGRGLVDRLGDLVSDREDAEELVQQILRAAVALPGPGWTRRIQAGQAEGPAEQFLTLVRQQVLARAEPNGGNDLETDCLPLVAGLDGAATELSEALTDLRRPMQRLAKALAQRLDEDADNLNSAERGRIEALSRSLRRRGDLMLGSWTDMLDRLPNPRNPLFVDWFSIEQAFGREHDVGLHCHWLDPTEPLAQAVLKPADGIIITSATLRDKPPEIPDDWENAEFRTGAVHLPYPVRRESYSSPFDYPAQSQIIAVNDVNREDMDQVAAAYRELFLAAGGGALGLFTAIARLKAVHKRIMPALAASGLPLFAQHVDAMDTATLVDMFRAEHDACLLGTDAVRDGVDVPGNSLRLIVMDRVPWATPTILERARREAFGGNSYTDMTVRLRLRQAFGRLIRSAQDRGSFVILDPRLASRFATAFPPGVAIQRLGLVDAIDRVRAFTETT